VFVAVYQKALSLLYVDELLQLVKQEFTVQHFRPNVSVCSCTLLSEQGAARFHRLHLNE